MTKKRILFLGGLLLATYAFSTWIQPTGFKPRLDPSTAPTQGPAQSQQAAKLIIPPPPASAKPKPLTLTPNNDFASQFGREFRFEYSPNGMITSIVRDARGAAVAEVGFSPEQLSTVLDRADRVIESLGLKKHASRNSSLTQGQAQLGMYSAQVFYQQTYQGVPVYPAPGVKIDLGKNGEVEAVYNETVPDLQVTNQFELPIEKARQIAWQSMDLPAGTHPLGPDGGEKIVWLSGAQGRFAYDFKVNGYQVIIDGSNGEVLASRNKRHHQS